MLKLFLPLNAFNQFGFVARWMTRLTSKQQAGPSVGSNPTVSKNL